MPDPLPYPYTCWSRRYAYYEMYSKIRMLRRIADGFRRTDLYITALIIAAVKTITAPRAVTHRNLFGKAAIEALVPSLADLLVFIICITSVIAPLASGQRGQLIGHSRKLTSYCVYFPFCIGSGQDDQGKFLLSQHDID